MTESQSSSCFDAASWQDFLKNNASLDLLMIAEGQKLNYGIKPIHLHWLDRVSLLLVRQAFIQASSLSICYPVPKCNLPVLACVQLLIFDLIKNQSNNLSILLISSRIEVRDQYLNLCVNREPIAGALPIARIRQSDEPAIISIPGITRYQKPVLYHLSRPLLIEQRWPKNIDCVIVDHTEGDFDSSSFLIHDICQKKRIPSVIHFSTDPFAPFLEELKQKNIPVWVWDHSGLVNDFIVVNNSHNNDDDHPFGVSGKQFQNILNGIKHNILICSHIDLEKISRRIWEDLSTVQRTSNIRSSYGVQKAIRAAYGVYYSMLQMLVPMPVYEEEARNLWGVRPINRRISDLEAFEPIIRDEAPEISEVFWPSLMLDLRDMAQTLAAGNPKYETLVKKIREYAGKNKRLTIVCPNQAVRRMLLLCLRAKEGLLITEIGAQSEENIQLLTYKELSGLTATDILIFPGQYSFGRRQYLLTAAALEICYLGYTDEADRIEQQIAAIHQTTYEAANPENRKKVWDILCPSNRDKKAVEIFQTAFPLHLEVTRSEGEHVTHRAVETERKDDLSLWTPFSTSEYDVQDGKDFLSNDSEDSLRPSEFTDLDRQAVLVPAITISFADGYCFAEPDSRMTILLTATERTDDRRADGLQPEDIVIFVDGDQRRQLYDAILERVERNPSMGVTYILVRYWQQAVREGFFRSKITYDAFLSRLQQTGSQMQTAPGIRCWVTGEVLGPQDGDDIKRVGIVLKDNVLKQECKNINQSLRRIRGLHISLARKLNRIIVEAGLKGRKPDNADECIDQNLNLYLDDFRDSVTVHRVVSVVQEKQQVPYVFTGKFFSKETKLTW